MRPSANLANPGKYPGRRLGTVHADRSRSPRDPAMGPCEHAQAILDLIWMGLIEVRVEDGEVRLYPAPQASRVRGEGVLEP